MTFSRPWGKFPLTDPGGERRPILDVCLRPAVGGLLHQLFLVDSGADLSMAPRYLCDMLGLIWDAGKPMTLQGISPREDCAVPGRVHDVEMLVLEVPCLITVPVCFADGDAPLLLGRDKFFDEFRITFDKQQAVTVFEQY